MAEDGEYGLFCWGQGSFHAGATELQLCVALEEMPGDAGAQSDGALEAIGGGARRFIAYGAEDVRIQDEKNARFVLAGELSHHQRAEPRGCFPVNMASAVGRHVVA